MEATHVRSQNRAPVVCAQSAEENDASEAIRRALGKARLWRTPPNWSGRDWLEEIGATMTAAGYRARFEYQAERGVPRPAFIYRRAITSAWTRYRQEYVYGLRFVAEPKNHAVRRACAPETSSTESMADPILRQALDQLSLSDRWLIRQLFWHRATEGRLAVTLRISQQAVSRRKGRALRRLRRVLDHGLGHRIVSKLLALGTFLLQILDSCAAIDCGL